MLERSLLKSTSSIDIDAQFLTLYVRQLSSLLRANKTADVIEVLKAVDLLTESLSGAIAITAEQMCKLKGNFGMDTEDEDKEEE